MHWMKLAGPGPGKKQCLCTGVLKLLWSLSLCKFEKFHASPVRLLFDSPGGEYTVYDLVGIYSDSFRPFTEAIAIPLQIFLMVLWHMFCHSRILTRTSIQTFMRSNPSMIFKNLNRQSSDFNFGLCGKFKL